MSYLKLIHRYLDEGISDPEKEALFARLAEDGELRRQFDRQISLHSAAKADMNAIAPPAAVTKAVFGGLGFAAPNASGKAVSGGALAFAKKYFLSVIAPVIAAGTLVGWFLLNSSDIGNIGAEKFESVPITISTAYAPSNATIESEAVSGENVENQSRINNTESQNPNHIYSNSGDEDEINYANNPQNSSHEKTERQNSSQRSIEIAAPMKLLDEKVSMRDNSNSGIIIDRSAFGAPAGVDGAFAISPQSTPFDGKFSASLRNFNGNSNPNISIAGEENPVFANAGMTALYKIYGLGEIGLAFGFERFSQKFDRKINGVKYRYEQNPMFFWYGAAFKRSFQGIGNWEIAEIVFPYAQIIAGGTSSGPILRPQVGLTFAPGDRLSFSLGAEAARLWYQVQGETYFSDKFGLVYGVNFKF